MAEDKTPEKNGASPNQGSATPEKKPGIEKQPPIPDQVKGLREDVEAMKQERAQEQKRDLPPTADQMTRKTREVLGKEKKIKIQIPSTETEKDPVVVGINGYVYQIQRDEVVEVPESVAMVLDDAKMSIFVQERRPDGEGNELREIVAQRIPYQTVRG